MKKQTRKEMGKKIFSVLKNFNTIKANLPLFKADGDVHLETKE